MKAKLLGILAVHAFLVLHAQADTYLSTLGNPPQSDSEVYDDGVVYEQWGIPFITGPLDYTLDSVTLVLKQDSGTSKLQASLYLADGNNLPTGAPISIDFTWSAIPTLDFGEVTFTPGSTINLDATSSYVFVLSTSTDGSYLWQTVTDPSYAATGGWSFPNPFVMAYLTNQYGSPVWTEGSGGTYHFMGAIEATPVPEPTTLGLGLLSLAVLGLRRSRGSSVE